MADRSASPPPDAVPSLALAPGPAHLARCLSTASSLSHGSATTRDSRDSLGSDGSSLSAASRQSSDTYVYANLSTSNPGSTPGTPGLPNQHLAKRRGYMRPQGTDFAASARSRESVLSLGSITHLQYYFARTGLLDLKGQLERRRRRGAGKARTLDLSQLDPAALRSLSGGGTQRAVSMGGVPVGGGSSGSSVRGRTLDGSDDLVASPVDLDPDDLDPDDNDDNDDWDASDDPDILPPTASTYMYRETPVAKPPSQAALRADLTTSLDNAQRALAEVRAGMAARGKTKPDAETDTSADADADTDARDDPVFPPPFPPPHPSHAPSESVSSVRSAGTAAWYEIQGMHILDVLTLAIRAAKVYYTSHERPDRLDAIKPERAVRAELLAVMDVLRRMATRSFAGGARRDELRAMDAWLASLYAMLAAEDRLAAADRETRAHWVWLADADWPTGPEGSDVDRARAYAREHAFLVSMLEGEEDKGEGTNHTKDHTKDHTAPSLPPWTPLDRSATTAATPTPFLAHLQSGVWLIRLHNCAVRRSLRRFGAIPSFHADTQKPYRAADNLRYWVKAAELRWEVRLTIDPLAVACSSSPAAWAAFEDAIYRWCRTVRREIAASVDVD